MPNIQIKSSVCYYDAVINDIASYLIYPNNKIKRSQYTSKQLLNHIFSENSKVDLSHIFTNFTREMVQITPEANQYSPPHKGYSLSNQFIAGHLLLAMIRMSISGITPSLNKAYYFYLEITQKDHLNWGKKQKKIRQLEQVWSEYKSIAHLALVVGGLGNTQDIEHYPTFLSALYRTQKLYLDIIEQNQNFDFQIWQLPFLDQLKWNQYSKEYPSIFIRKFMRTAVFEKLNEQEQNIMYEYSRAYIKKGGA